MLNSKRSRLFVPLLDAIRNIDHEDIVNDGVFRTSFESTAVSI